MRKNHANYDIVSQDEEKIVLRDIGPWEKHPTITNDAEHVVEFIAPILRGRHLLYYDSDGLLSKLLVENGKFVGFSEP